MKKKKVLLTNRDIQKLTRVKNYQILRFLEVNGIIYRKSKKKFTFLNKELDNKLLFHTIKRREEITLWKYEAKDYLLDISLKCKKKFYKNIRTSLVLAPDLPFIRNEKYLIKIKNIGTKYMLIDSSMGEFLTTTLVNKKYLTEGKTYIMIMGESTTYMEEVKKFIFVEKN